MIRIQRNSMKLMNKNVVFVISVRLRLIEQGKLFALNGLLIKRENIYDRNITAQMAELQQFIF